MRRLVPLVALIALLVMVGAAVVQAGNGPLSPELQAVRAATAKYNDVAVALADGYVPVSPCEQIGAGAMGVHYLNPALMSPGVNPTTPEVLLYLPNGRGSLKLVGVEYFQADADQDLTTSGDRPSLFGRGFDGPMPGHNAQMPIHYDLHVWVHERNPNGVFAQWNPAISCP
jgi:hypothetical protein